MKLKRLIGCMIVFLLLAAGIIVYTVENRAMDTGLDIAAVNDISQSLAEQWGNISQENLPGLVYEMDYTVLDENGSMVASTRTGLNETVTAAVSNRDTIVDIVYGEKTLGKLVLYNSIENDWAHTKAILFGTIAVVFTSVIIVLLVYGFILYRRVLHPFENLRKFAGQVAQGNLDAPLVMDQGNVFGAFTESFDLMREQLALAREAERSATQSKKELVASLSHDIRTPVASIKAVAEVMVVKTKEAEQKRQLAIIETKADQINALIGNLFTATLEELQELQVYPAEQGSTILYDMIQKSDYDNKVTHCDIPSCIILADRLRLEQVVDNIIGNSYKYAGTPIRVWGMFDGDVLEVHILDRGLGVEQDELPLLFRKFYRAKSAVQKSGSGLGLYISRYLMEKMDGEIRCRNTEQGFEVIIALPLA